MQILCQIYAICATFIQICIAKIYMQNMHKSCTICTICAKIMQKLCEKCAQNKDQICRICKNYATIMPKIYTRCKIMQNYAKIYAKYSKNMQKIYKKYAKNKVPTYCHVQNIQKTMPKICQKHAKNMQKYAVYVDSIICKYMQNIHRGPC